jgi:uncharacterized RDD family membrane protein YckC
VNHAWAKAAGVLLAVLAGAMAAGLWAADSTTTTAKAAAAKAGPPFYMSGDAQAVWLVAPHDDGHSLACKKLNEDKWQLVGGPKSGEISGVAAGGGGLAVFFARGGFRQYFPDIPEGVPGAKCPPDLWPAGSTLLAACARGDGPRSAPLALIRRPPGFASSAPSITSLPAMARGLTSTSPSVSPSAASAPVPVGAAPEGAPRRFRNEVALLQCDRDTWSELAVLPEEYSGGITKACLSAHNGGVYVLLQAWGGLTMLELTKGADQWQILPLPAGVQTSVPLAVLGGSDRLAMVTFAPATGKVTLSRLGGGQWQNLLLKVGDKDGVWPKDAPPAAAGLGPKSLVLAWRQQDKWQCGAGGLDSGRLTSSDIKVFEPTGGGLSPKSLSNIILWVAFGLIVLLMFWPGQAPHTGPFALPTGLTPAGLARRLVAFLIDAIPFVLLCWVVTGAYAIEMDESDLMEVYRTGQAPDAIAYASALFLAIFPAYCTVMERQFGATLGKMVMRLRVVGDGGTPLTWRQAALRNVTKIPEIAMVIFLLPIIIVVLSPLRQRIGDRMAWTAVVSVYSPFSRAAGDSSSHPDDTP